MIEQGCGCDSGVSAVEYFTALAELRPAGGGEGQAFDANVLVEFKGVSPG